VLRFLRKITALLNDIKVYGRYNHIDEWNIRAVKGSRMAIDDVQYLIDNSLEDSVQIFVDSDRRDRAFYPTPSEYVIHFEDPIKNVFGLEIMDGSIPSASYNVDDDSNGLRVITVNTLQPPFVPPFSINTLFSDIGNSPRFKKYLDDIVPRRILFITGAGYESADSVGGFEPEPLQTETEKQLSSSFALAVRNVVEGVRLETDESRFSGSLEYASFIHEGVRYFVRRNEPDAITLVREIDRDLAHHRPSSSGVEPVTTYSITRTEDTYRVVWFAILETTETSVSLYETGGNAYVYDLSCNHIEFPIGNYNLSQFEKRVNRIMATLEISTSPLNDLDNNQTYSFVYSSDRQFIFDMDRSSIRKTIGFNDYSDSTSFVGSNFNSRSELLRQVGGSSIALSYGENRRMFTSRKQENGESSRWSLTTPGIINLLGVRYVKLRCPEIEDFLNPLAGDKFGTGFGIFKLAGRNEVSHIRFDFVSVLNKKIHPIGKLGRLTFRFEKPDGSLYDFKGIDHHMLINIKVWVPTQRLKFKGSVLNEEYNPDVRAYLDHQQHLDPDSVTGGDGRLHEHDEEEDEEDEDDPRALLDKEIPFDYSTDESEYSDDVDPPMMMSLAQARADARHTLRP
jgi:hypothetical protein